MIKVLPRNILRFIILILLQVLILNNIQINGYINPYLYILFIILLPFETPGWLVLMLSFLLGFSIDVFTKTPGMHTSATVFMGFLRPLVLKTISPRDGYESGTFPRVFYYGSIWFLKYAGFLVLAHHLFLFYVEVFRFDEFFQTFLRVLLSGSFSLILIFFSQFIIFRK